MPTQPQVVWCGGILKVRGSAAELERFKLRAESAISPLNLATLRAEPVFQEDPIRDSWRFNCWGPQYEVANCRRSLHIGWMVYSFNTITRCLNKRFFELLASDWQTLRFDYTGQAPEGNTFVHAENGLIVRYVDQDSPPEEVEAELDDNGNLVEDEDAADSEDQGSDDPLEY